MLPSNVKKLKSAYRHPFEHINPRLYQKRERRQDAENSNEEPATQEKFFVDNEEEFIVLQGYGSSTGLSAEERLQSQETPRRDN